MNETIGRIACPVCGEPGQDVRINKNGILYTICDNGCRVNFTKKQSKNWLPVLRAGQPVRQGNIFINAITGGNNGTTRIEQSRRIDTIRRPDGQHTGDKHTGTTRQPEQPVKRGILAGFLSDDDE